MSKSILVRAFVGVLGFNLLITSGIVIARDKAPKAMAGLPSEKALALGERMYREGILPSGEPMQAVVSGDVPVAGTAFTCVSCHVRSGVGSFEGGIVTHATNGAKLALPRYWKFPNLSPEERKELRLQTPEARPAYTDQTLAHVLQTGIDPTGRELNPAMPRYHLEDQDMAILIHYLRALSATPSPGVDGSTIRFATVVTEEVSPEDQEAMLVPMNNYVARHNQYSAGFGNRMYLGVGGNEMSGSYRKLALSVWRLKGPPETWGHQLETHLAKDPVFALLGGISYGDWAPIHAFCERQKLPCLLPITDFPVVSDTDWYTQYFSKGYYQEGQAAARYLRSLDDPLLASRVLQIIQAGPEGRDLSAGFRETWQELGQGAVKEIRLEKGEAVSASTLQAVVQREKPTAILLWTGPESFAALEGLAGQGDPPGFMFMSSRLLGAKIYGLPMKARAFTWFTYPYRDPKDEPNVSKYANTLMAGLTRRNSETRISTRVFSLIQVLRQGLIDMDRNFYRDNFMDRIGVQRDQVLPDYLRLSFGPGQRYASKGCYIMQLSPGPQPQLVRKSEWVVH
jgi:hypothetical protein